MRFVVYGAGAIGGVIGAALHNAGHQVTLITRGDHLDAIRNRGLIVERPGATDVLRIPTFEHPAECEIGPEHVVLLAVKSQDTLSALTELANCTDASVPIVCVQNGVDNEHQALRMFRNVYGVCVMCPAAHLEPGVVRVYAAPTLGILDIGRYPSGADQAAEHISSAFLDSGFSSVVRRDIMRWKYRKLLSNLTNVIEAACGSEARRGQIARMAVLEGEVCLRQAKIEFASEEEDAERRGDLVEMQQVAGQFRPGGSVWQSLRRATGTSEVDYLNGEIAALGRLFGIPTPVNEMLQSIGREMASKRKSAGSMSIGDLEARVAALATGAQ